MNIEKIKNRIDSDYDYVEKLGYEVLGVFLQGSQNYQLDYEDSDIDTKAIIIPTLEDVVFNRHPVSTTIVLPSNEHIDIKDIRLMHECFKKQNINFIEILFTEYKKLNPDYAVFYKPMFENAEAIAHYNEKAALNCMIGMVYEKHKALCHPYPAIKDKIDEYGYDPKQLHHIIRVYRFLIHYLEGKSYKECLVEEKVVREYLISVKKCPPAYDYLCATELADSILRKVDKEKEAAMQKASTPNKEVGQLMDRCLADVVKASIKKLL